MSGMKKLQAELAELGVRVNGKASTGNDETQARALQLILELEGRIGGLERELQATRELAATVRKLLGGEKVAENVVSMPPQHLPAPLSPPPMAPHIPPVMTPAHLIPAPRMSQGVPLPATMPPPDLPMANNPVTHVVRAADLQVPRVPPVHNFGTASPAAAPFAGNQAAAIAQQGMPLHPGAGAFGGRPAIHPSQFRPRADLVRPPTSGISPESEGLLAGIEMPKFSK